jgi:purine-binding chemotaxis protein CheW
MSTRDQTPSNIAKAPSAPVSAQQLMPSDAQALATLRQRAHLLATETTNRQNQQPSESLLLFRLGTHEQFAAPYASLAEIMYLSQITPVPCTPAHIAGVVNRRGHLLTVLQLSAFFQVAPAPLDHQARIVVVSNRLLRVGLLVHEVIGNEDIESARINPPIRSDGVSNLDYVRGIYAARTTVLDIEAMLSDPALSVNESVSTTD